MFPSAASALEHGSHPGVPRNTWPSNGSGSSGVMICTVPSTDANGHATRQPGIQGRSAHRCSPADPPPADGEIDMPAGSVTVASLSSGVTSNGDILRRLRHPQMHRQPARLVRLGGIRQHFDRRIELQQVTTRDRREHRRRGARPARIAQIRLTHPPTTPPDAATYPC